MGTRSTYRVIEEWKDDATGKTGQNKLLLMYRQFDGYPSGHPLETAEWLASGQVVNGLRMDEKRLVFNGAGCLAAQLVAKYKTEAGGTYIHPISHRGQCWENYLYDIIVKEDASIEYVCYENGKRKVEIFRGTPADFVTKYKEVDA
jgi:hypothetical protein